MSKLPKFVQAENHTRTPLVKLSTNSKVLKTSSGRASKPPKFVVASPKNLRQNTPSRLPDTGTLSTPNTPSRSGSRLIIKTPEKKHKDVWSPSPLSKRMYRVSGGISELVQSVAGDLDENPIQPNTSHSKYIVSRAYKLNRLSWLVTFSCGTSALLISAASSVDLHTGDTIVPKECAVTTIGNTSVYFHWAHFPLV